MNESDTPGSNELPLSEEAELLIQQYVDEILDVGEFARLQQLLREHASVRRRYREATEMAVLLREEASKRPVVEEKSEAASANRLLSFLLVPALIGCVTILIAVLWSPGLRRTETGARLTDATDAQWLSGSVERGGALPVGAELRLASGSVELEFRSGASTRILGPASFTVESGNGGFLHYGKAHSVAENESSMGFTVRTASSAYIDQGTEFLTAATADGFSQMFVIDGAVDADAQGFGRRRVSSGNGIGFEWGENPIMIQIESGTGTPAFEFRTIPPPSANDFASVHPVEFDVEFRGRPGEKIGVSPKSASVDVLVDGRAQQNPDDPSESFFFRGDAKGYLIVDLGERAPVSAIHSYSWHRNEVKPERTLRAVQRYTMWGARDSRPASLPESGSPGGWTRIARVDTDAFFEVEQAAQRPPQQACRIVPASGAIGEFRYLLFEVLPTSDWDDVFPRHTFFSEIDIFTD